MKFIIDSESKAGPSNIGNVITQILLCKQITLDFNEEELASIQKDSEEIKALIAELQEFMPQSEASTGELKLFFVFLPFKNVLSFSIETVLSVSI